MNVAEFSDRARRAGSRDELFALLRTVAEEKGFEWVAYAALKDHERYKPDLPKPIIMAAFPSGWQRRYFDCGFAAIDPVVNHAAEIAAPFVWGWLTGIVSTDDAQRRMMSEAQQAGLKTGVTIPLLGPRSTATLVSFASRSSTVDAEAELGVLGMFAATFHIAYLDLVDYDRPEDAAPKLTKRERECLRWIARGKSSWDIGGILGISEHTVRSHTQSILRKLDVSSRAMAVAEAKDRGLLED